MLDARAEPRMRDHRDPIPDRPRSGSRTPKTDGGGAPTGPPVLRRASFTSPGLANQDPLCALDAPAQKLVVAIVGIFLEDALSSPGLESCGS